MGVEIERKFLINQPEWLKARKGKGSYCRQGYMLTDPEKTIRVRISEGKGYITIKGKTVGVSREEYEYTIPMQDAEELLSKFCSAVISKTRYKVEEGGMLWEIDEFLGDNEGLIIAEVELASEEESFDLPVWVGAEVTSDKRYFNSYLSLNPYKRWHARPDAV